MGEAKLEIREQVYIWNMVVVLCVCVGVWVCVCVCVCVRKGGSE